MSALTASPLFLVALTLLAYVACERLYARTRVVALNPVLLAIGLMVVALRVLHIEYRAYASATSPISFFLGPAVVAFGVALYQQLPALVRMGRALPISIGAGSFAGAATAVLTARALGATRPVVATLAPKSVTTPIAMAISERIGGLPPLAAVIVVLVGIFGAVVGPAWLTLWRVRSASARGLAMGAAAHVVGTSRAMEDGEAVGAASAVAIALNGLATAFIAPLVVKWWG